MGRSGRRRSVRSFAPGHVTGFFVPRTSARDPRGRGSIGAGLVLDLGVTAEATWDPGGPRRLSITSVPRTPLPISRAAAVRLRRGAPGSLEIRLDHRLPIGQGLGMSAAGSVATALAVARLLGRPRAEAWGAAHLEELTHRGGLGGVASIGGGGLEHRQRPGVPPWGSVRHRAARSPLLLLRTGPPIPSAGVLSDARRMARIETAGRRALARFARRPDLAGFLEASEGFTDAVGLADPAARRRIGELRSPTIAVAQAMFGRLLFVAPRSRRSVPEFRALAAEISRPGDRLLTVGRSGARLLPRRPR